MIGYIKTLEIQPVVNSIKEIKVDKKLLVEIAAASLLGFGAIYLGKLWMSYQVFKKKGLKTPPYKFFYGNISEILEKGQAVALADWTKKYGKTYGYFEGHYPIMVTSDLEIIDEMFYKQYSNFAARKKLPQQISDNSPDVSVFSASKNRWKRLRTITNQTFSPAKLKELLPTMQVCSDRLISAIKKNVNRELNISELLDLMAMDVVWNCTFGIDVDLIKNPDFGYFVKIRELLKGFNDLDLFLKLTTYFYEFKPVIIISSMINSIFLSLLNSKWGNPFFWLMGRVHEVIDTRIKHDGDSKMKKNDYVQLLIDAEADKVNLNFDNQQYDSGNMKIVERKMTRSEILSSLLGFMIAGFDTTASTLNFCLQMLLSHPEELTKLQDELDTLEAYEYESINRLEYLDMFIKEVLRMYPVAVTVQNRRCTKATRLKGIDIPEDLLISVDVLSLHYDPEYWPGVDPKVFYPLRFAPNAKYNKLAYMPFGAGARICVGMRFALLEIKLTLAKILKNFDISSARPVDKNLKIRDGFFTIRRPNEPLFLKFTKRA